jgi:hypothetical protein
MRLPRFLDPAEIRVLGSLLEKQLATPEYYPLTVKSLTAACNQRSNRDPVVDMSERDVLLALESLRHEVLVWKVTTGRAERWEQNVDERLGLHRDTKALLSLLLLRGPQTPGELRSRSDRLHPFESLAAVEAALGRMAEGPDPIAAELPRRPGQKEARWVHLLAPLPADEASTDDATAAPSQGAEPVSSRVDRLETRIEELAAELSELKRKLGES